MTPSALVDASPSVTALSDADLVTQLAECASERRRIDARAAVLTAEIARRSRPELGYSGMAQTQGARNAGELVQRITGGSRRDTRSLLQIGTVLAGEDAVRSGLPEPDAEADGFEAVSPWLSPVTEAVRAGALGVEAASAIRTGLGEPSETVSIPALTEAAERLVAVASTVGADKLSALARQERDIIDTAGVAEREEARREKRYLALTPQSDGMTRVHGLLDPESAAHLKGVFDRITSPRRGGPRFVDESERAREKAVVDDPRSTGQLLVDALVQLLRIAADTDDGAILGKYEAGVRVHVTADDLARGTGFAHVEGESAAISVATAERITCAQGSVPILFDSDGSCINVGREQRLFTRRQRLALAARDGGCRYPGCDRPPSWTEAHHRKQWYRDHGLTNVEDGILLCRFHHMLIHNKGYEIHRRGADYWLERPGHDPVLMPTRNPIRIRAGT